MPNSDAADAGRNTRRFRATGRKCETGVRYRYGRRPAAGEDGNATAAASLRRFLADWGQLWLLCGYRVCNRAGRCRSPGTPCFDRETDFLCRRLLAAPPFVDLCDAAAAIGDEDDVDDGDEAGDED
ncbi:MAG: hypothetical protein KDK07_06065 [Bauldia sp.]|nr:hypothetical protein [Bauldia sp.]